MRDGMPGADREPLTLRRAAGWALVAGLCVAAAVAVVAVLTGSFDDTDWRVIASSLGFSVFAAAAAAGAAVRLRPEAWAEPLGGACVAASASAYGLLLGGLWVATDADGLWRAFGIAALAALWTSHAALVLRSRRPDDGALVRRLARLSIVSLGVEASAGVLALLGLLDDLDAEPAARVLAALVVVTVLSTSLPPVLRKLARRAGAPAATPLPTGRSRLAGEVAEVADRLEAMELPPAARAEIARLRRLARDAGA